MKRTLALLFVFVVCVPMFFSVLLISGLVQARFEAMLARRAEDSLVVALNLLDSALEETAMKARLIARLADVRRATAARDRLDLIERLGLARRDLNLEYWGAILEVYDASGALLLTEPHAPVGHHAALATAVSAALRGEILIGETILPDPPSLTSRALVPIYHESGAPPAGALGLAFTVADPFAEEIKRIVGAEALLYVVPASATTRVIGSTFFLQGNRFQPTLAAGKAPEEITVGPNKFFLAGTDRKLPGGILGLAIGLDKGPMFQMVASLRALLSGVGIAAALFALALALLFSRRLTAPLAQLLEAARALGAGNLDRAVSIRSGDEFQFFGETFDAMRRQIKSTVEDLRRVNSALDRKVFDLSLRNRINQTIISKSEDSLFQDMLGILVEMMEVERCSLHLVDQKTGRITLKVAAVREGCDRRVISQPVTFELGEGIAGRVAATGEPTLVLEVGRDPRFKKFEDEALNREMRNLLTVPLRGEKEILGVLNLCNRSGAFTSEDLELMLSIADQVAIALQKAHLYELAITDGMTRLFIHRYFQVRLEAELARARRAPEKVSLVLFDIDHFKKFNDTHGHQTGDRVIRAVAEVVKKSIREGVDIPARYGGEEFVVVMPATDLEGAFTLAERIRLGVEKSRLPHEEGELSVTVSLGVATFPDHARTREELISRADEALYRSKNAGRNQTTRCPTV